MVSTRIKNYTLNIEVFVNRGVAMNAAEQKEWLDRWYEYIKKEQRDNADTRKKKIENHLNEFTNPDMVKLYQLLKARYFLMYEDLDNTATALEETSLDQNDKYHWVNYYYYFFYGAYYFERRDFKKALDYYMNAKLFISDIPIEETAELYYKLAAACTRTYQISRSIKYTNKAMGIFESRNHYKRMADCANLLGLNNHEVGQLKEAERRYHEALLYVEKSNNNLLKMMIIHNLGLFYTDTKYPSKALEYLNQVYSDRNKINNPYFKIQNLYLLADNYVMMNSLEDAFLMLQEGLSLSREYDMKDFYYQFELLKVKYWDSHRFEDAYIEAVSYFEENEWWEYVIEYGEELATYLRNNGKHRKAVEYYELAIEARNHIRKEREIDYD